MRTGYKVPSDIDHTLALRSKLRESARKEVEVVLAAAWTFVDDLSRH